MTVDANRVSNERLRVLIEDLEGDTGSIPTSVVLLRNLVTELLSRRSPSLSGGEVVLYGPYGWLNGHRGLSEDSWGLESDPLENNEEYFAIPLYAKVDPFVEVGLPVAYPAPLEGVTDEQVLASEILAELTRARTKFPGKNVTFAALVEEVGELATATFEESRDRVRKEAVQVAVMAMRMVLDGDHTFDDWRAEKGLDPLSAIVGSAK